MGFRDEYSLPQTCMLFCTCQCSRPEQRLVYFLHSAAKCGLVSRTDRDFIISCIAGFAHNAGKGDLIPSLSIWKCFIGMAIKTIVNVLTKLVHIKLQAHCTGIKQILLKTFKQTNKGVSVWSFMSFLIYYGVCIYSKPRWYSGAAHTEAHHTLRFDINLENRSSNRDETCREHSLLSRGLGVYCMQACVSLSVQYATWRYSIVGHGDLLFVLKAWGCSSLAHLLFWCLTLACVTLDESKCGWAPSIQGYPGIVY